MEDQDDLVQQAHIQSSSNLDFKGFGRDNSIFKTLSIAAAQMLPVQSSRLPSFTVLLKADVATTLNVELRISGRPGGFTPDTILAVKHIELQAGEQEVNIEFDAIIDKKQYVFVCFLINDKIQLAYSEERITGMLSVFNGVNKAVSNNGKQVAREGSGVDSFEFWCPQRRPEGQNLTLWLLLPRKETGWWLRSPLSSCSVQ